MCSEVTMEYPEAVDLPWLLTLADRETPGSWMPKAQWRYVPICLLMDMCQAIG